MSEPTPRPWRALPEEIGITIECLCQDVDIAWVYTQPGGGQQANADLIIRAVNSHDELVAALTKCRHALLAVAAVQVNKQLAAYAEEEFFAAHNAATAALAKARGEPA